jgi:hypothetical protein
MNRKMFAGSILLIAFASGASAQGSVSSPQTNAHYTQAQLKKLVRDAHTPEQYSALASYYGERQKNYLRLAGEEKLEWERRSRNVVGAAAKYPRPVDSARNLYEYYMYKASESGMLMAKASQLATPDRPVNAH